MDILEKKNIPQGLLEYINPLRYDNGQIFLVGSASLIRMNYASDIDLMTYIHPNAELYNNIKSILDKTDGIDNMYFIEGKVQYNNDKKNRWYNKDKFKPSMVKDYKDINFIKLDYIVLIHGLFTELSIIYTVNTGGENPNEIIESVQKDYNDFVKEGQYYKAMKRLFTIIKLKGEDKTHNKLTDMTKVLFNSDVGKLYKETSVLKAIVLYNNKFKDNRTAEYVYNNLGYKDNINNINKHIEENENIYNADALAYYKKHFA
jgi:hypothetical protein